MEWWTRALAAPNDTVQADGPYLKCAAADSLERVVGTGRQPRGRSRGSKGSRNRCSLRLGARPSVDGQGEVKHCTMSRCAFHPDLASMTFDYPFADSQPQS